MSEQRTDVALHALYRYADGGGHLTFTMVSPAPEEDTGKIALAIAEVLDSTKPLTYAFSVIPGIRVMLERTGTEEWHPLELRHEGVPTAAIEVPAAPPVIERIVSTEVNGATYLHEASVTPEEVQAAAETLHAAPPGVPQGQVEGKREDVEHDETWEEKKARMTAERQQEHLLSKQRKVELSHHKHEQKLEAEARQRNEVLLQQAERNGLQANISNERLSLGGKKSQETRAMRLAGVPDSYTEQILGVLRSKPDVWWGVRDVLNALPEGTEASEYMVRGRLERMHEKNMLEGKWMTGETGGRKMSATRYMLKKGK